MKQSDTIEYCQLRCVMHRYYAINWAIGMIWRLCCYTLLCTRLASVYATSKQISMWPTIDPLMTNSSGRFKDRPPTYSMQFPPSLMLH